ncbi:MAG: DMT family transporter [Fimbriimonadaceae bacterium]|nr:DMT family transporter [Fimbriimonadaceae bacterium]
MSPTRQALLALQTAVLLFGLAGLVGRQVTAPPLLISALRALLGGLALTLLLAAQGRSPWAAWRGRGPLLAASGALLGLHWWLFFAAIQRGGVALGLLTFASYPAFVLLLGWGWLRQPLARVDLLAVALVMLGLVWVVPDWRPSGTAGAAAAAGIASGATFAWLTLLNRRLRQAVPALSLAGGQMLVGGVLLLPLAGRQLTALTAPEAAWLVLLGVVFTGCAHGLFTWSLPLLRVGLVGVSAALEPVYGIAAAWLLLGEAPRGAQCWGGLLVLGATLLIARQPAEGPGASAAE